MKKILLISICIMLLFTGAIYAKDINEISLNGEIITFHVEPIREKGTTLVPMRTIFEALGATVTWNSEDKSVSAVKNNINVWLQLNSRTTKINDEEFTLEIAPKVVNGSTLVPIRFVTETFGEDVEWDAKNKRIMYMDSQKHVKPTEKSINEEYNLKISDAKEKLNLLCQQISSESNTENINKLLTDFKTNIGGKSIGYIYFAKETGEMYAEPNIEFPAHYDARIRPWYKDTKEKGEYTSKTYTDITSGNKVITIAQGIYKNGKFIGVVGLDVNVGYSSES